MGVLGSSLSLPLLLHHQREPNLLGKLHGGRRKKEGNEEKRGSRQGRCGRRERDMSVVVVVVTGCESAPHEHSDDGDGGGDDQEEEYERGEDRKRHDRRPFFTKRFSG
jgi:hypothetical protein